MVGGGEGGFGVRGQRVGGGRCTRGLLDFWMCEYDLCDLLKVILPNLVQPSTTETHPETRP